jgi:alkylhydroperoxidase family enzyme
LCEADIEIPLASFEIGSLTWGTKEEISMRPMFLPEVERKNTGGAYAHLIDDLRAAGEPVPQIMHLFAYKPDRTDFLSRFTQSVMRGPSPLPAGIRELIAAFTSRRNDCLF